MLFYAYSKDADSFSPLLANGEQRWITRFGQKIDALWVPGTNPRSPWAILMEFDSIKDLSNIGLSTLGVKQVQIGLVFRYF
jgi:hypothetical protein